VPTVNEHLKGIFAEGELAPEATVRSFRIVRSEGTRQVARDLERAEHIDPALAQAGWGVVGG